MSPFQISRGRDYRKDAALRPQSKLHGLDFWPTPESLINPLVAHVLPILPQGIVWECACGDGRLANAIRNAGRKVIASDVSRGDRIDFLRATPPLTDCFGAICTNPPFRLLDEFIARGLDLIDCGATRALVLLLRNDALMTSGRVEVLNHATFVLGCNWRARWIPDSAGQPRWAFSWVVWRNDHSGPPVTLRVRQHPELFD